jgi:diguanylate cyclase (GGDEF)-like protein
LAGTDLFEALAKVLREAGIAVKGRDKPRTPGFPVTLALSNGEPLTVELPEPALVSGFNPDSVGLAVLDGQGYCRAAWGVASRMDHFDPLKNVLTTELAPLLAAAYKGVSGSAFMDGFRFFVSGSRRGNSGEAIVLVVGAFEELEAKRQSVKYTREAEALKRFGRLLSMNQNLAPLCNAAVHELDATANLAAVLMWTLAPDRKALKLSAQTGTNRMGVSALGTLALEGSPTCVAEMVALSRQPFFLDDVRDHVMTKELEARFCYLQPGGLSVHPLYIGGNMLGIVELLGRQGDPEFADMHDLFQTLTEHLALAVNSAMLFENMEKMANDDALTGIANHRTLQQFLLGRLSEANRTNGEVGLMMIDVDHFRSFNEEEGHDVGDMVLRHVAEILRESVRPYDLAARYGGEEFTVVLPGSGIDTTLTTAERIRRIVEAMPITTRSGRTRHVTVSIGCANRPAHALDAPSLIQAADTALFQAKREGRNRVVLFSGLTVTGSSPEVSAASLWEFVPKRSRPSVERRLGRLEPILPNFARSIGLSEKQVSLLRGLLIVEGVYRKARLQPNSGPMARLQSGDGIRVLLPSLAAMDERFDGKGRDKLSGPKIPLLSRALAVLLAYDKGGAKGLSSDPGRFDPEIVRQILSLRAAA